MARLGDVCKLVSGTSLPETIVTDNGELPYVKVAELNMPENIPNIMTSRQFVSVTNISAKQIIPIGTVIFPKRGGAIGTNKKRLVSTPICMDLNLMGVIPSSKLYPEYLYYFFENIDMGSLSNGSSVPQINNSDIAPLEIRIPDISTQKDIATHLDKVGKLIALRKEQLAKLDRLVKSRFIELFGDYRINEKGFDCKKGSELFKFSSGKFLPEEKRLDEGIPVYGGNGIAWYTSESLVDYPTIIIGRVGAQCGNIHAVTTPVWITDNAIYIKEQKTKAYTLEFLTELMRMMDFYQYADFSGQPKITQKPLETLNYIMPPIELQNEYTAFVKQTDKSKLAIQQSLDKLELLKKSLMQEYFG